MKLTRNKGETGLGCLIMQNAVLPTLVIFIMGLAILGFSSDAAKILSLCENLSLIVF